MVVAARTPGAREALKPYTATLGPPLTKTTALGGGIGIHGWAGRWVADGRQDLTWGCISLQNEDLDRIYDLVDLGTPVLVLP